MKTIFTDNNGQVQAVYTGKCNSIEWENRGYTKYELEDDEPLPNRDEIVTINKNRLGTRAQNRNNIQPNVPYEPDDAEILKEALGITDEQFEAARAALKAK